MPDCSGRGRAMTDTPTPGKVAIAIHGGAGTITQSAMTAETEAAIRAALQASVQAGYQALLAGASSTEAVIAAVNVMEDSRLFNAGRGAVFNAAGEHEMDASIMEGRGLNAGAVASVAQIKNPIDLAAKVMTDSEHVMLVGDGAEEFARQQDFAMTGPDYFHTEFRWQQLQRIKEKEAQRKTITDQDQHDQWFSTVGAVALDQHGDLAAATSTGGTSNKRWGRVGDSPIIGAGTYASNRSCAVSATGHGEFFIRHVVAYNICNRVELGAPVAEAANTVVNDVLVEAGGEGGVIAIDREGSIAMPFNSEGMYRASVDINGEMTVSIYRNKGEPEGAFAGTVEH
ncbi:MAG: isoaspartyl peptidase/L-asparaginase [Xanthomonadales bacterium]|nr:isoaspartyl peptidase/L-asparaginase [Gammaproteobacteria bacterium]NNK04800.1 isoaspartyl peptidase/L-asparaginase [Xanthomonadales bacterium]